jgi:cytoskeletal protein CcmA (bactofilin family)
MFGRKGEDAETDYQQETTMRNENTLTVRTEQPAQQPTPRTATPALARRVVEMPGARRLSGADAERKLIVGKGLSLAGEITSCDVLVVEGKVEAKLTDGKLLEIAESGQFRGAVEIENADIAGRYDGQLVVHGRLTVRATGRISGSVKYGELEVNAGGQIIGELQVTSAGVQATAPATGSGNFKSAAKFTAVGDEDEAETATARKKSA